MKNKFLIFILLLVCCIPAIYSLFHMGFFSSDDGEWMVIRFSAFFQALRDGQFPVRFLTRLNFGYGYPVANFLYPGFMYLGVPIHVLGFGFVDTIKIILGVSMVGSAVFCYLWLSKLFGKWASFVGSMVYLYTPYHLYDLYKRGSVGEVLALAVLPFILWQIERKSYFWMSLGIGFLLLAHNTLALLFLGVVILYMSIALYVSKNKKSLTQRYVLSLLTGFGMSAFFWVPALHDLKYTVFYETQISNWSEYFAQHSLVGLSTYGILLSVITLFATGKIKIEKNRLGVIFILVGLLSVFLSLEQSTVIWQSMPVAFIQFPFRFLSLTIVAASFLAALVVSTLPKKQSFLLGGLLIALTVFSATPHLKPQEFFDKGEGFYSTNEGTTTVKNEYMPIWMKNVPTKRAEDKIIAINSTVSDVKTKTNSYEFKVHPAPPDVYNARTIINAAYFPGWVGYLTDSEQVNLVKPSEDGALELLLPILSKTESTAVRIAFTETWLRFLSDIVSLVSIIILVLFSLKLKQWKS